MNPSLDPLLIDLLFTLWASLALLGLVVAAAVVLPWTAADFAELDDDLAGLRRAVTPPPVALPARARRG